MRLITTNEELKDYIASLAHAPAVAIDTEFLREHTYFPQLCLVQIAYQGVPTLIDPLEIDDMTPLADLLENTAITKIFHAATQDLEALSQHCQCACTSVFDTQLAAGFLGMPVQMSYAHLVEHYEKVRLSKSASLSDWSQRPLDTDQLEYAADDVLYLERIFERQFLDLVAKNRLGWYQPEMQALLENALAPRDPYEAYTRLKRTKQLTRRQSAVAREICAWRELRAQELNRPRKHIVSDELLFEVARLRPKSLADLSKIRSAAHLSRKDVEALLKSVKRGCAVPDELCPEQTYQPRLSQDAESILDVMNAVVRSIAHKEHIASQLIASRADLQDFYQGHKESPLYHSWRFEIAGILLQRLLEGEIGVTVKSGSIDLI